MHPGNDDSDLSPLSLSEMLRSVSGMLKSGDQERMVEALRQIDNAQNELDEVRDSLLAILSHNHIKMRRRALRLLHSLNYSLIGSCDALLQVFRNDKDQGMRWLAIQAMGDRCDGARAITELIQHTNESEVILLFQRLEKFSSGAMEALPQIHSHIQTKSKAAMAAVRVLREIGAHAISSDTERLLTALRSEVNQSDQCEIDWTLVVLFGQHHCSFDYLLSHLLIPSSAGLAAWALMSLSPLDARAMAPLVEVCINPMINCAEPGSVWNAFHALLNIADLESVIQYVQAIAREDDETQLLLINQLEQFLRSQTDIR